MLIRVSTLSKIRPVSSAIPRVQIDRVSYLNLRPQLQGGADSHSYTMSSDQRSMMLSSLPHSHLDDRHSLGLTWICAHRTAFIYSHALPAPTYILSHHQKGYFISLGSDCHFRMLGELTFRLCSASSGWDGFSHYQVWAWVLLLLVPYYVKLRRTYISLYYYNTI
jgi:hypothetical protein